MTAKKLSIPEVLEAGLMEDIKKQVEREIINTQMKVFEQTLTEIVRDAVSRVTLGRVEQMADFMEMTEKLNIEFKWDNEND